MVVNIGRGVRQQSSVMSPANRGMAHIAQRRLVQYVGIANAKHLEAIKVDGTEAEIWIKQSAGRVCSCQHPQISTSNSIYPAYESQGVPVEIQQVQEQNPFTFKIKSPDTIYSGEYSNQNVEPPTEVSVAGKDDSWLKEFNVSGYSGTSDYNNNTEYTPSNLMNEGITSLLFGGDKSPCAVCFGTGWTDGYRLVNGQRVVLDTTAPHNISGATINTDDSPYTFRLAGVQDAYIEWLNVDVPRYFKDVHFAIYNNTIPVQAVVLIRPSSKDGEYIPLSFDNLKNIERAKIDVKVIGTYNNPLTFTHLNFVYTVADFPKIDTPPIGKSENYEFFEALMTTHFEIPGTIPYVDRETVIGIAKEGYLWKVSSVNQIMTHERQIFKCDVDARLIQRSETLYLLNSMFRPKNVYNFRGLERIQGLSNYIDRQYRNLQGF